MRDQCFPEEGSKRCGVLLIYQPVEMLVIGCVGDGDSSTSLSDGVRCEITRSLI